MKLPGRRWIERKRGIRNNRPYRRDMKDYVRALRCICPILARIELYGPVIIRKISCRPIAAGNDEPGFFACRRGRRSRTGSASRAQQQIWCNVSTTVQESVHLNGVLIPVSALVMHERCGPSNKTSRVQIHVLRDSKSICVWGIDGTHYPPHRL